VSPRRQVMLLTGCASGIGCHLAGDLLREGHRLLCTDIALEKVTAWIEEEDLDPAQVGAAVLDVRDPAAWSRCIEEAHRRFGSVDVVMNIAGYLKPGRVEKVTVADVDSHIDINVKGVIHGTRAAAEYMVDRGSGHIINIGSLASLSPVPGLSLYAASKFAVRGFSLSAAQDLRPQGVALTLVLLDAVKTPMLDLQADYEEAALTFSGRRPLSLEQVAALFRKEVLPKRPLEVTLPAGRGALARAAGMAPDIARWLAPVLTRRGRAAQARYRDEE
jgi:3-oxoacyl-[acyl-carrier protein] reductase